MQVTKYLILVFEHSKIEDSQQLYMHFMKYCGDVATLAFCSAGPCFFPCIRCLYYKIELLNILHISIPRN